MLSWSLVVGTLEAEEADMVGGRGCGDGDEAREFGEFCGW